MKKILSTLSSHLFLLGVSCAPTAAENPVDPSRNLVADFFNSSRIGLGVAIEYLSMDAKVKLRPERGSGNLGNIDSEQSQTGKHFQIAPSIEMGGNISKDYYLGLLLSWRYSGSKSSSRSPIFQSFYFHHELTINHYTDLFIKAGYNFTPCSMLYGLVGPTLTNWRHTSNQVSNMNQINSLQMNRSNIGLGVGLGFEYIFKKNYAFSIDFTHRINRSTSRNHSMSYSAPIAILGGGGFLLGNYAGTVNKKIDLSFSTIAIRFTKFF